MGRTVPWVCWEEWAGVRDWLLSSDRGCVERGIRRVEAWRARGRVPLGVDITASLMETALCDPGFLGLQQPPAAAGAAAGTQRASSPPTAALSQQQLRLQYGAAIVRMVNGIADSQQKGRVARSVNSLAEAAGLSRLLVDVRHEATHNELPSLSTLQLAARQALDWLVSQYWQRQSDHLAACTSRAGELVAAVVASCEAAAAAGRQPGGVLGGSDDDEGDAGDAADAADADADQGGLAGDALGEEAAAAGAGGAYRAAEGRKHRRHLLAELKVLLPASHTPLLAGLLLDSPALPPPEAAAAPAAAGEAAAAAAAAAAGDSVSAKHAALTLLHKQYPALLLQLVEEAVSRLCWLASPPASEHQQQPGCQPGWQLAAGERAGRLQQTEQLLAWLRLLLPRPADTSCQAGALEAAAAAAPDAAGQARAGGNSLSRVLATKQQGAAGSSRGSKARQQPQPLEERSDAAAAVQQLLGSSLTVERLQQLLADVQAAIRASGAAAGDDSSSSSALQHAQQRLVAALALVTRGGRGDNARRLAQLCSLTAPTAPSQQLQLQQQQQAGSEAGCSWLEQQQALLTGAADRQRLLLVQTTSTGDAAGLQQQQASSSKKRGRSEQAGETPGGAAAGRWRRTAAWHACAIGCLPGPQQPAQLLACLQVPQPAAAGNDGTAAGVANGHGQGHCALAAAGQASHGMVLGGGVDPAFPAAAAAAEAEPAEDYEAVDDDDDAPHGSYGSFTSDDDGAASGPGAVQFGARWRVASADVPHLQASVQLLLS